MLCIKLKKEIVICAIIGILAKMLEEILAKLVNQQQSNENSVFLTEGVKLEHIFFSETIKD